MTTEKSHKLPTKYSCETCNYHTGSKKDYNKHVLTAKHLRLHCTTEKSPKIPVHICECGKKYKHHSSLWKHKQKCTYTTEEEPKNTIMPPEESNIDYKALFMESKAMFIEAMKRNDETMKETMKKNDELHQTIKEMVPLIGNNNTITNNNTNNNYI